MNQARSPADGCYDDQVLRLFNSGRLVDVRLEERVAEHLGTCTTCESRLESFNEQRDSVVELLRQCQPDDATAKWIRETPADGSLDSTDPSRSVPSESTQSGPSRLPRLHEQLPLRIDRYFVIRQLGSGGFGQVFLAKDPEHDRLVAIKVPLAAYVGSQRRREQFLREARTAAALVHPHIVPVYDCRELPDGRCIVVMKYVEGRTLQDLIRSERVEPQQAAAYVASIADALHCAHQRGIWHRDVKPANILLDRDNQPYLVDFGLAIHERDQRWLDSEFAGTYPYMSPEQIRGESRRLDGRSDIWSLGVILYELLARERPFRGSNREQFRDEILQKSPQPLRQIDPKVTRHLERVCLKCLMKEPADRYRSAAELAAALRRPRPLARASSLLGIGGILLLIAFAGVLWFGPSGGADQPSASNPATTDVRPESFLRPLAWSTLRATDYYDRDPATGRIVVVSSASISCFETNRPTSSHYRLATSVEVRSKYGMAGYVLGLHQINKSPEVYRCLLVYTGLSLGNPGTWLEAVDCEIRLNELRHPTCYRQDYRGSWKISDELLHEFSFSVGVDRGRIDYVSFNDQPLPEFAAKLKDVQIPPNSGCGITESSHVIFHYVDLKEIAL